MWNACVRTVTLRVARFIVFVPFGLVPLGCGGDANDVGVDASALRPRSRNGSEFVAQSIPSSMDAGATYAVSITMKNTGTKTWTSPRYRLGSQNPQDTNAFQAVRAYLAAGESIPPGATKTFSFKVTAPTASGTYDLQYRMVEEGVTWFGTSSPNVPIVVSSATAPITGSSSVPPPPPESASPYGVLVNNVDHASSRETIASLMQRAKDAGARWVRVDFFWYSVQWSTGATYDWHFFDYLEAEASARGLQLVPILWGTPAWAVRPGHAYRFGPPVVSYWEKFVTDVVNRYKSTIKHWEVWNEPDTTPYWTGSASQYAEILATAHSKIKAADPSAIVVMGGLAQGGPHVVPNFLESVLGDPSFGACGHFDYHNVHTNFRTMAGIVAQLRANKSALANYGCPRPVVVTENSYTSDPAFQSVPGYAGGEPGQAQYLTDSFRTILGEGAPFAIWAALADYASVSTDMYSFSGLVRSNLATKQAFSSFRTMAP